MNCLGKTMLIGWTHSSLVGFGPKQIFLGHLMTIQYWKLPMTCTLVHHGVTHNSTTLVICVHELFGEDHAYWVDIWLTCRVCAETELPRASDDHLMLEIAHDLQIRAPWSATHFYYTCDVYMDYLGKTRLIGWKHSSLVGFGPK